jgi:hypothetical protein
MIHDPLCAASPSGVRSPVESYGGCSCALIAKVRVDERVRAIERVRGLASWEDGWPENRVIDRSRALLAVAGEE